MNEKLFNLNYYIYEKINNISDACHDDIRNWF